ncbi:ankyrin repeat domain-containing protein [Candidatus Mesenet endosymbiont of Agriotes lineatus]|uniref:ankyrin repeat domain-containing protein n=1 Tax=Candidatus Mesenet endosymbiont of Agriotes lineatus TaxID=3077948 RepID=UPI0030D5EE1F
MSLINLVKIKNNKVVEDFFLGKRDSVIIEEQKKKDVEGKTALMHAVIDGNLEMVKLLCEKIDITTFNAQDKSDMTAVMHAAKLGHSDILKFFYDILKKLTDDINEQNFSYVTKNRLSGLNALMIAIVNGHVDCLEFLYCKKVQHIINHQDNEGRTAIVLALAEIAFKNMGGSKEEIENAKSVSDELLRIIKVVFNERDKKYLNSKFDNKLDLTIQDEDKLNIFAYAKEVKCEKELLDFIASISMDAIIPDLSVRKLLGSNQSSEHIKCSEEDLTGWDIFDQASTVIFEGAVSDDPITKVSVNDIKQIKKCNNKKVKVTFNKPGNIVTSCDMQLTRVRDGI